MNSGSAAATVGNVDLPSARRTSSKLLFVILGALSLAATWNPTVSAVPYAAGKIKMNYALCQFTIYAAPIALI